jgi:hypothetical protein
MNIKPFSEVKSMLKSATQAWVDIVGYIRTHYVMDELFDGKNELKFRRSGKTLVTFYIREGYFTILIIYGKKERALFEERQAEFPQYLTDYYKNSKTFHDGKWMFIDVYDESLSEALIHMLQIKKKPNRQPEDLSQAVLGKCGNRCDLCLLNEKNNIKEKGNLLFQQGDCRCYHSAKPEDERDYSQIICKGCYDDCAVVKCVKAKQYNSCIECDYRNCNVDTNNFTNPGECNLGLSNEDLERFVLPYCGKERFQKMQTF